MKPGEARQHVPIFVGSTFQDLKDYRAAVLDALTRLQARVHGMEYFGARPGSPVDECLKVVQSCKVYIGIFAMRYGSIPDGETRSMTHIEYDEAQRLELPSLIYLIDEEIQPVLPKHVDTGASAEALRSLKADLSKRHMIDRFTTPDDLARRLLLALPELLSKTIGATVEGKLEIEEPGRAEEFLRKFLLVPKTLRGREVIFEFKSSQFASTGIDECGALRLSVGSTVQANVKLLGGLPVRIYASDDVALKVIELENATPVVALGVTVYGAATEDYPPHATCEYRGIRIVRILEGQEYKQENSQQQRPMDGAPRRG